MNKISLSGFYALALLCAGMSFVKNAQAGNGHVDRAVEFKVEVKVDSISSNGLKQMKVNNSVLKPDEIKYLDLARKYLLVNFGNHAANWAIMIDLINSRVLFLDPDSNQMTEIQFKAL